MYADIEALVLSGKLFGEGSRDSSPERADSLASNDSWDEAGIEKQPDGDLNAQLPPDHPASSAPIGMGPGRTGVKGVIRDQQEAEDIDRGRRRDEMVALRTKMEKQNLGGKTFLEEERTKGLNEKVDDLVVREREKKKKAVDAGDRKDVFGRAREGRFGHLREVGRDGFVAAVEKEDPGTWVIVHIYDPCLERCDVVDDDLSRLARIHPDHKFLRVRAAALGFAAIKKGENKASTFNYVTKRIREKDEDDPYASDGDESSKRSEDEYEDDDVDSEVLPTMLVYRNGQLSFNWVRVDWEAGGAGIEGLLDRHNILSQGSGITFADYPTENDDLEYLWSDED